MKKLLLTFSLVTLAVTSIANEVITIAASPVPHAEILRFVAPALTKEGYTLKVIEFSDYVTPNTAVIQKQVDANFFQTKPYLAQFNKDHHSNIVDLVNVHLEPMGVYAGPLETNFIKSKNVADLVQNSKIGVPNDPTNEGRALNILEINGVLKIKPGVALPTKKDIVSNPYGVTLIELEPAMLPRALKNKQLDIAVINSNVAMQSGLNPTKDAVLVEAKSSPYANLVGVRPEDVNKSKMKALAKALTTPAVKQFIEEKYKGAVVPAF